MNEQARSSEPPDEPYLRSNPSLLSPASPKPLQFPQPTNIPVLENMMDVGFNQTEAHMNDPAMRNTELRPDVWRDATTDQQAHHSAEHAQPFSTGGHVADSTKGKMDALRAEDAARAGIITAIATADPAPAPAAATSTTTTSTTPTIATIAHSNETVANGHHAPSLQLSNGIVYDALSHLQADVPDQIAATDKRLPSSDPSVPAAEPETAASHPAIATPHLAALPVQSNEIRPDPSQPSHGAVDVQALLDELQTSIAPAPEPSVGDHAEGMNIATTPSSQAHAQPPIPGAEGSPPLSASGLAAPPSGLPPRPPPQDQPLINPNYIHSQHIRDYHPHAAHPAVQAHTRTNSSGNVEPTSPSFAQNTPQPSGGPVYPNVQPANPASAASSVAPTPQGLPSSQFSPSNAPIESRREYKLAAGQIPSTEDQPWTADIQKKYDHFMEEERRYVNEARWDQFPTGSRLFVGNLSSEKVTKRDIFHVFHSYGELAQISIKQAYGFVQFLNKEDCARALEAEQSRQIRDKRIHLEISKPQKSNKNQQQQQSNRRSRSPDFGNRGRSGSNIDRYVSGGRGGNNRGRDGGRDGGWDSGRDGGRDSGRDGGRDGYRSGYRSPSPRGYRDRYEDRYRTRSRSPGYGRGHRSPKREMEDDLPLPRRQPRDVPDVQIIALDQLDRDFLSWVEQAFTSRAIRVDVLILSPRLSEEAVVRRQIVEGVLAVSKLKRDNQESGKIGLTIFKRQTGSRDVQFEEYDNLDPHICVELVLREKPAQGGPASGPPSAAPYNSYPGQYGAPTPQYGYQQPSAAAAAPPPFPPPTAYPPGFGQQPPTPYGTLPPGAPPLQHFAANMDASNLQNLLSTLNHVSPNTPQTGGTTSFGQPPTGYTPQAGPQYGSQQQHQQQQPDPYAAYRNNPALASYVPASQPAVPPQPAAASPPGPAPPNMQDILNRLRTYGQ